jgi:hypothetical protein
LGLVFEENNDKKLGPTADDLNEDVKVGLRDENPLSGWVIVGELFIGSEFSFEGNGRMPRATGADSPWNQSTILECLASFFATLSLSPVKLGRKDHLSLVGEACDGVWCGELRLTS